MGLELGRAGTKNQRLQANTDIFSGDIVANLVAGAKNPEAVDQAYSHSAPKGHRRRFAQFFTPPTSASLMADWVSEKSPRLVLDPALGTGILARAVAQRIPEARIIGCEIDPLIAIAARKANTLAGLDIELREADFLDFDATETFDGIIANPPYLRHHDLANSRQRIAQIGCSCGLQLSGLTNAYALFLLDCCRRLREGGRLAFLVPTEWTNANFGQPIKEYLLKHGLLRAVVYVCHTSTIFEDALTTASILLVEKSTTPPGTVRTFFVPSDNNLPALDEVSGKKSPDPKIHSREFRVEELLQVTKWDDLIRRGDTRAPEGFVPLRLLAKTKRGIATGANSFFHIPLRAALEYGIEEDRLVPCVGKANDVASLLFTAKEFRDLVKKDRPTHLINLPGELSSSEQAYVEKGEAEGLHQRYLTQKRSPWYSSEKIHVAPIWAAVFGREHMRFIVNAAQVAHLTAFHGVYPLRSDPAFVNALAAVLNSSIVQDIMKSEMRVYGGGLNKVEPRDLLEVKVPDLRSCSSSTLESLSAMMAGQQRSHFTDAELNKLDELVLRAGSEAAARTGISMPAGEQPPRTGPDQLSLSLL